VRGFAASVTKRRPVGVSSAIYNPVP
jgi:hypothetical protein